MDIYHQVPMPIMAYEALREMPAMTAQNPVHEKPQRATALLSNIIFLGIGRD